MTIKSTIRKAGPFLGDGYSKQFPFTFKVFLDSDLLVVKTSTLGVDTNLTLATDYVATLNTDQDVNAGGNVVLISALLVGEKLTVTSQLSETQGTDLQSQGGFYPGVVEDMSDRTTILIQQLREALDRTFKVSISSTTSAGLTVPAPVPGFLIGWNSTGTALINVDPASTATVAAYSNWRLDSFTAAASQVAYTLTGSPGSQYNADVWVTTSGVTKSLINGTDFTISGNTMTLTTAPATGATVVARYGQSQAVAINVSSLNGDTITGTSYQPVLIDANGYKRTTNASAITYTVPDNATTAFAIGTLLHIVQGAAGQVTVGGLGGVTIGSAGTLKTRTTNSVVSLLKVDTNVWQFFGDTA
jgi:hypothetical protein